MKQVVLFLSSLLIQGALGSYSTSSSSGNRIQFLQQHPQTQTQTQYSYHHPDSYSSSISYNIYPQQQSQSQQQQLLYYTNTQQQQQQPEHGSGSLGSAGLFALNQNGLNNENVKSDQRSSVGVRANPHLQQHSSNSVGYSQLFSSLPQAQSTALPQVYYNPEASSFSHYPSTNAHEVVHHQGHPNPNVKIVSRSEQGAGNPGVYGKRLRSRQPGASHATTYNSIISSTPLPILHGLYGQKITQVQGDKRKVTYLSSIASISPSTPTHKSLVHFPTQAPSLPPPQQQLPLVQATGAPTAAPAVQSPVGHSFYQFHQHHPTTSNDNPSNSYVQQTLYNPSSSTNNIQYISSNSIANSWDGSETFGESPSPPPPSSSQIHRVQLLSNGGFQALPVSSPSAVPYQPNLTPSQQPAFQPSAYFPQQQQQPQGPQGQQPQQPFFNPQQAPGPGGFFPFGPQQQQPQPGPGQPPFPEPENGFNPHFLHPMPEPPYESEFIHETPLEPKDEIELDAYRTKLRARRLRPRQRRPVVGQGPQPLPFSSQSSSDQGAESFPQPVETPSPPPPELLVREVESKPLPPRCAYNTITKGDAEEEDCVEIRKKK